MDQEQIQVVNDYSMNDSNENSKSDYDSDYEQENKSNTKKSIAIAVQEEELKSTDCIICCLPKIEPH